MRDGRSKPTNLERDTPSVTVSLHPKHLDRIREAARTQRVSQSAIVREALDRLFQEETSPPPPAPNGTEPTRQRGGYPATIMAPVARELAAIRRDLSDLRQAIARLEADEEL